MKHRDMNRNAFNAEIGARQKEVSYSGYGRLFALFLHAEYGTPIWPERRETTRAKSLVVEGERNGLKGQRIAQGTNAVGWSFGSDAI